MANLDLQKQEKIPWRHKGKSVVCRVRVRKHLGKRLELVRMFQAIVQNKYRHKASWEEKELVNICLLIRLMLSRGCRTMP